MTQSDSFLVDVSILNMKKETSKPVKRVAKVKYRERDSEKCIPVVYHLHFKQNDFRGNEPTRIKKLSKEYSETHSYSWTKNTFPGF